jgi:hypothetical protein
MTKTTRYSLQPINILPLKFQDEYLSELVSWFPAGGQRPQIKSGHHMHKATVTQPHLPLHSLTCSKGARESVEHSRWKRNQGRQDISSPCAMAELAAIGLAGNIVQFVDFGFKLSHDFKELYESTEGGKTKHLELQDVTTDLESLCQKLQNKTSPATQDDEDLRNLARACTKLARELLAMLEKLKANKERNPKLATFKQALKNIWKDKDISDLEQRLGRYREQLNQRLIYILRYVLRTCMPRQDAYACLQ